MKLYKIKKSNIDNKGLYAGQDIKDRTKIIEYKGKILTKKQVEEIVKNGPATVVAVSCNPNTFARDSQILVNGGYQLKKITSIDQFLWSPHVELVAEFYREN